MSLDSSTERWLVNGTSLSQYAWAVKTFGGTPRSLPLMRGNNIGVSYIPGQIFRPKFPDQRVISLLMWTAGLDPATGQPSANQPLQFSDNLRTLQKLFYSPGAQLNLTREWYYTSPAAVGTPVGVPTLIAAIAQAQVAGDMQPTMTGQGRADFTVDLLLADPYFYGAAINTSIPYNTATTIYNPGDDAVAYKNFIMIFTGPLLYPRLTNNTNSAYIQLNTLINAGDTLSVDIGNYAVTRGSDGADMRGIVQHSASKRWMALAEAQNSLLLSSSLSTDTGSVSVSFQPPYV